MKIKAIMPDKAMDRKTLDSREEMLKAALSSDVEISVDVIREGPDELDCHTDEAFASEDMIRMSIKAEEDGFDAIVIYCFSDVAIDGIRENVSIPVIGPGETTLAVASTICNRFTVITTESSNIPRTYRRLMKNPVAREKMASVRALDIPIGELRKDPNITGEYLMKVCQKALEEDGADGIILGCLGMASYGKIIEEKLKLKVFDPAFIGIAYGEMCARLNLSHTELMYPKFKNISNVNL